MKRKRFLLTILLLVGLIGYAAAENVITLKFAPEAYNKQIPIGIRGSNVTCSGLYDVPSSPTGNWNDYSWYYLIYGGNPITVTIKGDVTGIWFGGSNEAASQDSWKWLVSFDASNHTTLQEIGLGEQSNLETCNLSGASAITGIDIRGTKVSTLDLSASSSTWT